MLWKGGDIALWSYDNTFPVKVVEKCDSLKSLPKNNKNAATLAMKDELGILKDALGELEEARSNGFMESFDEEEGLEEQWKEEDLLVLNPSCGLIKTAVALVKKTIVTVEKSGLEEGEKVVEFDRLMPRIASLRFTNFLLNIPTCDFAQQPSGG